MNRMLLIPRSQQPASVSQIYILVLILSFQLDIYTIISGEGVPYNVSVTPVNLAGPGSINSVTLFTRELSK